LQKLNLIHNDFKQKYILYKKQQYTIIYKIKNKEYQFKSNYIFYISDFGISAHPHLSINLITNDKFNIPNYDLKKFSHTIDKLKAFNLKEKYTLDNLLTNLKKSNDSNYLTKLTNLKKKTKTWTIDENYKNEYIHLHLCYYYVKKGLFNIYDYVSNAPSVVPESIEDIFKQLNTLTVDLDEYLLLLFSNKI
jgi:hypothetical protein